MTDNKFCIMVVEDEELLLKAVTQKLENSGYKAVSCLSGQQAFDYLNNFTELPDAIWLDYYLKDTNGLEFVQKLKENSKWKDIPVIVVSNSATPEKVNTMIALGVKEYLLKAEYRLEDLVQVFDKFLKHE